MFTHVLLEVYCGFAQDGNLGVADELLCKSCGYVPSYNCLFNKCPYVVFTSCENSACYIGEQSEAEKVISFGGEMEEDLDTAAIPGAIDLWEKIAIEKINEAYDEYMATIGKGAVCVNPSEKLR